MNSRHLAAVGVRLEEAVCGLLGECRSPADIYDRYEEIAIELLDGGHAEYAPSELQDYLADYLAAKRRELGLPP